MSLLADVKNYLDITWDEDDAKIGGYIARGQARLNTIAGTTLDFEEEGSPRSLLFDYCRYANSKALEVFEKNFMEELTELHYDNLSAAIASEEAGDDADDGDDDADDGGDAADEEAEDADQDAD